MMPGIPALWMKLLAVKRCRVRVNCSTYFTILGRTDWPRVVRTLPRSDLMDVPGKEVPNFGPCKPLTMKHHENCIAQR